MTGVKATSSVAKAPATVPGSSSYSILCPASPPPLFHRSILARYLLIPRRSQPRHAHPRARRAIPVLPLPLRLHSAQARIWSKRRGIVLKSRSGALSVRILATEVIHLAVMKDGTARSCRMYGLSLASFTLLMRSTPTRPRSRSSLQNVERTNASWCPGFLTNSSKKCSGTS